VGIEFLENNHRQKDVVFLEAKQTHRIVQQHIGGRTLGVATASVWLGAVVTGTGRLLPRFSAPRALVAASVGPVVAALTERSGRPGSAVPCCLSATRSALRALGGVDAGLL
jgi:hypothetical protein